MFFLPSVPLRLFFGHAGFSFGSEGRLTRTLNEDFHFPLVPLRLSFGYPSVMRVFYKFLKNESWFSFGYADFAFGSEEKTMMFNEVI